ncbi:Smr/MutS family protein [Thiomicrorhabdus sp.]|uniref:Smr/MutS family protein n=1 Tax=Thiomicrorhabdus sp. TaxID=2039724 RepID=UPI002AA887D1|nr:Smr/MutS family protein [Thiomicrorhabdus sp.]
MMQEKDKNLFLEAMLDVVPLAESKRTQKTDYGAKKTSESEIIQRVRNKHKHQPKNSPQSIMPNLFKGKQVAKVTAFESLIYHQKGVRIQELNKLKKGELSIQHCLDLHGLTIEEAEIEIIDFLNQAYSDKSRNIRIIHGKGYNSHEEFPALKNLVNLILRKTKNVIAFASTPEKQGGTGAVNILLKAQ